MLGVKYTCVRVPGGENYFMWWTQHPRVPRPSTVESTRNAVQKLQLVIFHSNRRPFAPQRKLPGIVLAGWRSSLPGTFGRKFMMNDNIDFEQNARLGTVPGSCM
jgi:hypothetical protein